MNNKEEKRIKGGVGGKSTRMRERFSVVEPARDVLQTYLSYYNGKDLYLNIDVTPPNSEHFFGNSRPLQVDFGCGRGEYIIAMAQQYPEKNFLGIDFHLRSLYVGINAAAELKLPNIRFISANASQLVHYIPSETIEKASVLFPAPIPNPKFASRDLIKQPFVEQVHRILGPDNILLFVSDAKWYFDEKIKMMVELKLFSLAIIEQIIGTPLTRYQKLWENKGIPSNKAELQKLES